MKLCQAAEQWNHRKSASCLLFFSSCRYLGEKRCIRVWRMKHTPAASVNGHADEINAALSPECSVSALFVLRHRRVCHADALLPVQHGVCQPARQPSLRLPARLHQGGRVLLQRYVCSSCLTRLPPSFWSSVVANELKVFFWSAGITSSLFKCSFNKQNEI